MALIQNDVLMSHRYITTIIYNVDVVDVAIVDITIRFTRTRASARDVS
jgi:hypothetical protein